MEIQEQEAAILARYRVNTGKDGYHAIPMNRDEVLARRAYMRAILRVSFLWCKMNNEQLDNMRLYKMGDDYIVEDTEMSDYILIIDKKPGPHVTG